MVGNHSHHVLLAQVLAGEDLVVKGHFIYHIVGLSNFGARYPLEVAWVVLGQHFQADQRHLGVGLITSETTKEVPEIFGKVL